MIEERLLHSTISMEKRNAWLEFFVAMLKKNNTDVLRRGYQAFYEWGTDMQKGKTNQMVEYSFMMVLLPLMRHYANRIRKR